MTRLEATLEAIAPGNWTIIAELDEWGETIFWSGKVCVDKLHSTLFGNSPAEVEEQMALFYGVNIDAPIGTPEEICPVAEFPNALRKIERIKWGYSGDRWHFTVEHYEYIGQLEEHLFAADTREDALAQLRKHLAELNEEGT